MITPKMITCNQGAEHRCAEDWSWQVEAMRDFDIWLVCRGVGWVECDDCRYELVAGDCLFIRPGKALTASHDPKQPLRVVAVHFDINELDDTPSELAELPFHCRLRDFSLLERLLFRAIEASNEGQMEAASIWICSALAEIGRAHQLLPVDGKRDPYADGVDAMCREILAAPAQSYQVAELAGRLHVCPDHFSRLFRRIKGVSPQKFIVSSRLDYAKALLLGSSHPVSRVAELCGYESVFYFSKHFKKHTGMSPSEFRR